MKTYKSNITKRYRNLKNIFGFFSFVCVIGPLVTFISMGLMQGEGQEKLCLTLTSVASIILALLGLMRKVHLRSTVYIAMIGLWIALDNIVPFIITLGLCTIFDELLFSPLYKRFKEDYHTNKQIDKRYKES